MKECIAMLLAGGQGSRLYALTKKLAKPAVPFGGKYRIIDFPLSNCVNSGIDTVGILTQYQPLLLNEPLLDAYEANMAALGEPVVVEEANRLYRKLPTHDRDDAMAMQYLIPGWKFDPKMPALVRWEDGTP